MKYIEIDEELYRYIASKTERIGESASDILRRLLDLSVETSEPAEPLAISHPSLESTNDAIEIKPVTNNQVANVQVKEEKVPVAEAENIIDASEHVDVDFKDVVHEHMLAQQKGAVGRFMFLLESLSALTPKTFEQILKIQGRGRLYFARSKAELLSASQSANPKEIGESGYWVTTNNNTAKKRTILSEVLLQLGCNEELAQSISERI
ncbi:replication initiation negative regulator SeqA [Shewanella electrodiphila]|uniref:Negative modulator of initiation of replication n=1 Tax=Shewanella electrodiphila TaxID=934143 RepID=A0ABT0KSK1_9GAMM|nr:replication initiation negative regulator SeqA [Shewanella electrodiphila]MCL1046807.1 replication initiation negative regulator SeqA [Shewanella electrodiphila]